MNKPDPTPLDAFVARLARLARKHRDIEGLVFWGGADGWDDRPSESLEAEEIAFYAEGLLIDGFRMLWQLTATVDAPDKPDHVRLCFWQDDSAPPAPASDWIVLDSATWTGA